MKEETKLFWYAVITFLLSLVLLSIGVFFYFYQSIVIVQPPEKALRDFAVNLALWESIVGISGVFLIYRLFNVHLRHKRETQEIFKGLFQAVSHRFGNFLATQKVILELLKANPDLNVVQRLEENVCVMERDFLQLVFVLKNLEKGPLVKEKVSFSEMVDAVVRDLRLSSGYGDCKVEVKGSCWLFVEPLFIKTALALLLDNSFRYGRRKIYIRCGKLDNNMYCFIANEKKQSISKGTGLGLKLSRYFIEQTGGSMRIREKENRFSVLMVWKKF